MYSVFAACSTRSVQCGRRLRELRISRKRLSNYKQIDKEYKKVKSEWTPLIKNECETSLLARKCVHNGIFKER